MLSTESVERQRRRPPRKRLGALAPTYTIVNSNLLVTPWMAPIPSWLPWLLLAQTMLSFLALGDLFRVGDQLRDASRAQKTTTWMLRRVLSPA